MEHSRKKNTNYIIALIAVLFFAVSVSLTVYAGVGVGIALVWNVLASLYIYYDLIPVSIVDTAPILLASLLDAFVFALFAVFLATWFTELIRSINISEYFSMARVRKLRGHVIVVPFNNFSKTLVDELQGAGVKFVVMVDSEAQASRLYARKILSVVGTERGEDSFRNAGIERAAYVVACGDNDVDNALVSISAKDANPNINVISRVIEEENIPKLDKAGASWVIIPNITAGASVGNEIVKRVVQP